MADAIAIWDEESCRAGADRLAALFSTLWPNDDWSDFRGKLAQRPRLCAVVSEDRSGALRGVKLGYARYPHTLYSWLGGVRPDARGSGLAAQLMTEQHELARSMGFRFVETSTRQGNPGMAILNLKAGFDVVGVEAPPGQPTKILFRKVL